jgi:hypothetical protein
MSEAESQLQARQRAFLAAYAKLFNISRAAELAGVGRRCHYDWLRDDPEYAERFEDARQAFIDELEEEAYRRAVEGWDEPVFYEGVKVGAKRKYSDNLLMFRLKAELPQKYRDRHEITGPGGGSLATNVVIELPDNGTGDHADRDRAESDGDD